MQKSLGTPGLLLQANRHNLVCHAQHAKQGRSKNPHFVLIQVVHRNFSTDLDDLPLPGVS